MQMYRQMRYFISVVETNSFFEAGEACHISQSAISQQIRALENELQVQLLERHGRRFTVTPAGKYFYEQAKRQTAALDGLIREVRRIGKGEYQRLRVGVLNGFSSRIMQQAIREFAENHPHVRLSLVTGPHEERFPPVNEGSLDMVINDQWRALSDQYINEELTDQPMYVLLRQDHPCALSGSATVEGLQDDLCILVCAPAQRETEAAHGRDVLGLQSSFLFADNVEAALMNAAAGMGFWLCDGDRTPPAGTALVPLMRGERQLTRRMFAFWPESSDSSLQWEFTAILHRIIK